MLVLLAGIAVLVGATRAAAWWHYLRWPARAPPRWLLVAGCNGAAVVGTVSLLPRRAEHDLSRHTALSTLLEAVADAVVCWVSCALYLAYRRPTRAAR